MKIKDIIIEGRDGTIQDLDNDHESTSTGITKFRDKGGYDRTYNINRVMMAAAMADGKSKKAVDMPQSSWVEKYNTVHPYTDAEHNMMQSAFKTVDSEHHQVVPKSKSQEHKETYKQSPVPAKKKNRYGV